jgi:alkylation response protein AidB-like acyl-CoA dehydrogenase
VGRHQLAEGVRRARRVPHGAAHLVRGVREGRRAGREHGFVGLKHAGPTLIACGTEAQKRFHLPKILGGDVVWCQGFSEPNAGSDLAALQTRAVIEGDELVVTGQKIWTSFGQIAEYQELLVRTDPDAPKHKGITWVICPMDAPGIEIRPIKTLAGNADFCEVFYDNVRIPLANVVGKINDGWRVAMATLSFERGTAFMSEQVKQSARMEELIALARSVAGPERQGARHRRRRARAPPRARPRRGRSHARDDRTARSASRRAPGCPAPRRR